MKITRILLQAGHGGVDKGAVANGTTENKEVNEIIAIAKHQLALQGYNVVLMQDTPFVQSISDANRMYNSGDLAVEVHLDSFSSFNASMVNRYGVYYNADDLTSKKACDLVSAYFKKETKNLTCWARPDTASRFGRLGWIRDTKAKALLFEMGFVQDKVDNLADQYKAKCLVEAIKIFIANYSY